MEKKSIKELRFRRFFKGNNVTNMKGRDITFLVLSTLIEIGFPIYFLLGEYKMSFPYNALLLIGAVVGLFVIIMDLEEFFQSNYVDLLFFKLSTFVVLMLIAFVVFIVYRWEFVQLAELEGDPFTTWMIKIVFYIIFLIGSFLCVIGTDLVVVIILRISAFLFKVDMTNQYMEKLKYAKTVESSKEYTRLRIKAEYENRFQEASIDEKSFELYCNEQNKNIQDGEEMDSGEQSYLFENTKHFKMITSLEQVDSRYEMLMKIYMPHGKSNYVPEICKEIQKEYRGIKSK